MGRFIKVELNDEQRAALEKSYRDDPRHAFRLRCQMVLLKSRGRKSREIAEVLDCCEVAVNNWLKRYKEAGLEGLRTKAGRGRRPILDQQQDAPQVRAAVRKHRQRISLAKAELEHALSKDFSQRTLVRFLKSLVADINESGGG
jgi:transposase